MNTAFVQVGDRYINVTQISDFGPAAWWDSATGNRVTGIEVSFLSGRTLREKGINVADFKDRLAAVRR